MGSVCIPYYVISNYYYLFYKYFLKFVSVSANFNHVHTNPTELFKVR